MTRLLSFIDKGLHPLFQRLESSTWVSTEQLACFRVVYGAMMLLYFLPSWSYLNDVPPAFFNPYKLSFAYLTNDYLPNTLHTGLDILIVVLLLFITLGIYSRWSLLLMYILSSILFSYTFSFGKIDHFTNLFLFTYPVLAFTNAGTRFALIKDKPVSERMQSGALMVLGVVIAFGLFNAGISKCMDWIDFNLNTSGYGSWLYYVYFNSENTHLLVPYMFNVPTQLFEPMDYLASIFEVVGIFFLLKGRRYWVFYLLMASFFHLANLFTLNLSFALNTLTYGIFIVSPVALAFYKKHAPFFRQWRSYLVIALVAIAIIRIIMVLTDNIAFTYHADLSLIAFELGVDIVLWVIAILCGVRLLTASKYKKVLQ